MLNSLRISAEYGATDRFALGIISFKLKNRHGYSLETIIGPNSFEHSVLSADLGHFEPEPRHFRLPSAAQRDRR